MQKEIRKDKGTFVIGYWQTSDDINLYITDNYSDPIKVFFYPNTKMTENECENYVKNYITELKIEIINIISENQQFYENFDISFNGSITGFSFMRDEINWNKLIISDIKLNPDCKLKIN